MLVTLADTKAYLGIPDATTTHDAWLNGQIAYLSEVIENFCRRKFNAEDYIQSFYHDVLPATKELKLYHYPIITVDEVLIDDEEIEDFRINKDFGYITRSRGGFLSYGEQTDIRYRAGYETVPLGVQNVVFALIQERFNKKTAGIDLSFGSDVQRISIPGVISVDFDYSLSGNEKLNEFGSVLGNYVNALTFYRSERAVLGDGSSVYVDID